MDRGLGRVLGLSAHLKISKSVLALAGSKAQDIRGLQMKSLNE